MNSRPPDEPGRAELSTHAVSYLDAHKVSDPSRLGCAVGVTKTKSAFRFPHSFAPMEIFKIVNGPFAGRGGFVTVPCNMPSAW